MSTREQTIRVYKLTDDEWYPSYRLDIENQKLVEVSFLQFIDFSGYRCCVWGADDDGMDFDAPHRELVWNIFEDVIRQEKVNKAFLRKLGFVRG